MQQELSPSTRKIIHVDMDCFFAAVEMRDNPMLRDKPVAVGGRPEQRGVLSTCNYIARRYGLHSAMSTARALKLCPKLVLLPGRMEKYKAVSKVIRRIFKQYTPLVEPLSLDEAFLDVTNCPHCKGSATLIAQTIRRRIYKELRLTASAGVAPNKFLAKVASDWKKPNGLFVITPDQVADFVRALPVEKIFGVGKVTARKMHELSIRFCSDLQQFSKAALIDTFGKSGERYYDFCRGIDHRPVITEWLRKSLSAEETFPKDVNDYDVAVDKLKCVIARVKRRLDRYRDLAIHKQFIKIKFSDFKQTTVESVSNHFDEILFVELFRKGWIRQNKPIRLIGAGVRFGPSGAFFR
jgi:DNA polymerase-4